MAMRQLTDHITGQQRPDTLLVLLPPAEAVIEDFRSQGFIAAVRERRLAVDVRLAELTYRHVMAKTVTETLHSDVVQPALASGYRNIWLVGISLGAYNALHYAAERARFLAGVYLIAPYPGTSDVLSEISASGGASAWCEASPLKRCDERAWWHWLYGNARRDREGNVADCVPVFMGTGNEDRFVRGQRMLADLLPPERVHYVPGSHAWPTWQRLWSDWLDHAPFADAALPIDRGQNA